MSLQLISSLFPSITEQFSLPNKSQTCNLFFVSDNNLQKKKISIFAATKQKSRKFLNQKQTTEPYESIEVEVKLHLPDSSAHQKLSYLLAPHQIKTHIQHNFFFDTANADLSSNLAVLRIRFYDNDRHCVLSLKAKPAISEGISRIEEHEEQIDPMIGRACVDEPERLLLIGSSEIMERVKDEYGIGLKEFVCLGGFRNVRKVYEWKGLKLELDETIYDFGIRYEIECESDEPERARDLIEAFLKENGIDYWYSETSKFAVFRSGKLP